MRLVWGTVSAVVSETQGAQRFAVDLDDGSSGIAVSYPRLVGRCEVGERVLANTTAVDLSLGTGGTHFVVAREGGGRGVVLDEPSGGHVMKLRYSPMQVDVLSVEAQESPHHEIMAQAADLGGMPVVCCGLHSQVPLVAAAAKRENPDVRITYCMTDHAALAIGLSHALSASLESGLIDTTITCGQAIGGMREAVNLHSGLLAARHVDRADVAIVAIGPGVVGTGTPFGHGGVAQGEAINAVGVLGGTPIACLRVSFADERRRHRGVSHHTLTALTRIALVPARVPIPELPQELLDAINDSLRLAGVFNLHERVDVDVSADESPSLRGLEVRSMGRGMADDPAFFAAAFAAGQVAARQR